MGIGIGVVQHLTVQIKTKTLSPSNQGFTHGTPDALDHQGTSH